jgi:hypothetical protein
MSLPNIPPPVSGISMSLLHFDKIVRLSECGEIYDVSYNPLFVQWDATAQCDVSVNDIKNIFAFQSDHFDVDDMSANDIRFYVDNVNIPTLDLSSNVVYSGAVITVSQTNGTLTGPDMYVQKDYVRHLAAKLFNTAYGVDLFINEEALVQSVQDALQSAWSSCKDDLLNISIVGSNNNLVADANGEHKYLLHDAVDASGNSTFNICRELFKMMVSRVSSRFTALSTLAVDPDSAEYQRIDPNALNLYRLPFEVGDQLVMRVVIKPCAHQDSFQNNPIKDEEIQSNERAYLLHLNLVA